MQVDSAIALINSLIYKPDWAFEATDHTNRFEGAIKVTIHYPARNSNRDQAPSYMAEILTYAIFPIIVTDCDEITLYRRLLNSIIEIEIHEAREFLRVNPTMWAPFHPHRVDGMRRWGQEAQDFMFGIA